VNKTIVFLRYWGILFLYLSLIFFLSSKSDLSIIDKSPLPLNDKVLHGIEYFILSFLAFRAFLNFSPVENSFVYSYISGFSLSFLYALTDEFHQFFIPGRMYDYHDFLADITGATIVIFVNYYYYVKIIKNRKEDEN
jgi:VanZ family protein